MGDKSLKEETCRVLVIGANRTRLEKVINLLVKRVPVGYRPSCEANQEVEVEYLPCVAKFDVYEDETGKLVRYLVSVEHFPQCPDGTLSSSSASLLPYFDEEDESSDVESGPRFLGISGAAIGSGIEGCEDTARIHAFIKSMVSGCKNKAMCTPILKTIEPNPGYRSMQEELVAYKLLTVEEKDEASRLQHIGPSKMAKFVTDFTAELLRSLDKSSNAVTLLTTLEHTKAESKVYTINTHPPAIDLNKKRFSCRKCRTILFDEADLQDPPHEPSQHTFSYRKQHHGAWSTSSYCQSYFLQDSMNWMKDDIKNGYPEGKFFCPVCDSKLGNWTWSGAQCSCGTWVVPAIQIPKSKVDLMAPQPSVPPFGAHFHKPAEAHLLIPAHPSIPTANNAPHDNTKYGS